MELKVTFPEKLNISADYKGFKILADIGEGSDHNAPRPMDLFLASLATCASSYILGFCRNRNIPTDNISVSAEYEIDENTHLVKKINYKINIPADFPEKYKGALPHVMEKCHVARHFKFPPEINVEI